MIIWRAVPLAVGHAILLSTNPFAEEVQRGGTPSSDELDVLYETRMEAVEWLELPHPWLDTATADILALNALTDPQVRRARLMRADDAFEESLVRNPASPQAWFGLAITRDQILGPGEEAASALAMSLKSGPSSYALSLARARMAIRLWNWLAPEERKLALRQIHLAVKVDDVEMIRLAASNPLALQLVKRALLDDPPMFENFRLHVNYEQNLIRQIGR